MGHERLKHIKENLLSCIEGQVCNIYEADAGELGEAIDMLKDLEEALYYCTITEAMEGKSDDGYEKKKKHHKEYKEMEPDRMYYSSPMMYMDDDHSSTTSNQGRNDFLDTPHDPKEGRSPSSRRMYMEAKQMHSDKASQLRELEKYMQELTNDMVEMISDASLEEKQYLEKKINTLAAKIGQMK